MNKEQSSKEVKEMTSYKKKLLEMNKKCVKFTKVENSMIVQNNSSLKIIYPHDLKTQMLEQFDISFNPLIMREFRDESE